MTRSDLVLQWASETKLAQMMALNTNGGRGLEVILVEAGHALLRRDDEVRHTSSKGTSHGLQVALLKRGKAKR